MKKLFVTVLTCLIALNSFAILGKKDKALRVGVTAGPHVEILEFVKTQAKAQGLNIKIVEFSDFILPNAALDQGDIDVNSYQHLPFLENQVSSRGYKLSSLGKTILLPMGLYSQSIKNLDDLKIGSKIAIPNDPTNGGRALLLLQREGLIKLKSDASLMPSILDIKSNPKKFKIIELDAPQIPRSLADVSLAAINTDWAMISGIKPEFIITKESTDSPYANIIVAKTTKQDDPRIQQLLTLYQSQATADFIQERFGNAIIPAWNN